jgi:succinate-semialdehyde dehydrogenase / glutarate-semialdehyde dehydrogenase
VRPLLTSVNPWTGELVGEYPAWPDSAIDYRLGQLRSIYDHWRTLSIDERCASLEQIALRLLEQKDLLSLLMAQEMGKPLAQGRAEIQKCARLCRYYAENAGRLLACRKESTSFSYSAVHFQPVGAWLAVMPWNYPFWQVFRCLIPAIVAGNLVVLKHASNVTGCGLAMESLVTEATGLPLLTFMPLTSASVPKLVSHPFIKGVSFTGSDSAGKQVAIEAAKSLKPAVLELGGSNALIVTHEADLDLAATDAVTARFQNSGQSCIAAKRLIVHKNVYADFMQMLVARIGALQCGDPMLEGTNIGPLARPEFSNHLQQQVQRSLDMGATERRFGQHTGAVFAPVIIENATPAMPAFREELFGPVLPVFSSSSWEESIALSNGTRYGLGVSVYHRQPEELLPYTSQFHDGAVFFNHYVVSEPALPFGGTKYSGMGRELGEEGIRAFTNVQTVVIR